jgi:Flp pilus assembly protein TadG
MRRLRLGTKGNSAAEFAMVIGPLCVLLFGTIEFGRLLWTRDVVQQVAVEGARCMGILAPGCATAGPVYSAAKARTWIAGRAQGFNIPLAESGVALNRSATCASAAGKSNSSEVTVTFTFASPFGALVEALASDKLLTVTGCFTNAK